MGSPRKYKEGMKFGEWTLLNFISGHHWIAKCSCGKEQKVHVTHLSKGKSTRCRECYGVSTRTKKFDHPKEYSSWNSMKDRCLNPNNDRYHDYGGRGITICKEWIESFETFLKDMGERPKNMSIDRINNDGNYEPSNCKWSTPLEQANNKRAISNSELIEIDLNLLDSFNPHNLSRNVVLTRVKRGMSVEEAINKPLKTPKKVCNKEGICMTIKEWANMLNVKPDAIRTRLERGWEEDRAIYGYSKCS